MDLATISGLIAGAAFVLLGIALGGGSVIDFFDLPSVMITLGGTLAATLVTFPASRLRDLVRISTQVFKGRQEEPQAVIDRMVAYAVLARREGLLALEPELEDVADPFLRKGLELLVDGTEQEKVRAILEIDLASLSERHRAGARMFESMASFAPAFGLVGTLIGLILMLQRLDSPGAIGPAMSVALLTTLYGAMLSNLVFTPMAGKLKVRSSEEILRKELVTEGLLAILAGESPFLVAEKLNSFLAPHQRVQREDVVVAHHVRPPASSTRDNGVGEA